MIKITPNFHFNGKCEQAIRLYEQAFDVKVECLLRYSDARPEDYNKKLTKEQSDYVYHAELYIGDQRIMMADVMDIDLKPSRALSLTVTMETKNDVIKAFEALKDGSEIIYPIHSTTYSSCTCSLVDKFGFRWIIMTEQTER
ncbi:MAG: VOC family protein [Clostridiales bacterium]|nr:VOC family protein [Clostridiales bacterium]